MMLSLVDGKVA